MKWLLLCLHLFFFHFPSFSSFNFSCHHDEYSALLHFKSSFTLNSTYSCVESNLMKTATWKNGSDCCLWDGVTCDTISAHVIGINVACEGLEGMMHPNSTLFHLSHLTHLDLSYNDFEGEVPPQISHLSKLTSLHLSYNRGLVWKETTLKRLVRNTTNLRDMFLDDTNMSSIKLNSIDFIFNQSSSLVTLNLGNTDLRGVFKQNILCLPGTRELYISYNYHLEGKLPDLSCSHFLRILNLSGNNFDGPIPPSFSNLTYLTSLNLHWNSLNGPIPSSLLILPSLTSLDLSSNILSGQIPNVFHQSNRLQELDLSDNKIGGELPISLSNLRHLTTLSLSNNLLNGTIPSSLLSLPYLESLDLTNNRFTGHISATISYSLEELYLCGNRLQGNIPKSIFNLSNLTRLCLSSNNLSGVVDFQHFSKLQNLFYLSLSHNSQLSLNFESNVNYNFSELSELELSSLNLNEIPKFLEKHPNLSSLDMSNNRLTGSVPNWLLHKMIYYGSLNLSQNMFTSIDHISNISYHQPRFLDLSSNLLQGELSASICNISSLEILNLAHNNLTGIIPQCLVNLPYLQVLDLQMNKFYGTLSNKFSMDNLLLTLNLYGNHLEGCLPETLSHCKYLEVLNLGSNRIEDKFPEWLQTLEYLRVLVLRDNKLHGLISNLRINCSFPNLIIFDISGNNFSGPLPKTYFKKFQAMKDVDGSFEYMTEFDSTVNRIQRIPFILFYYSVTVRIKGITSTLVKIPTTFAIIDMSRNKFEGDIPNFIGDLYALIGLNLSHNRFSGIIPQSMGNLTNLESLDLSSNMLTGVIPVELSNLNFLEFLDLSNNQLVGEIPQGKQFNTFSTNSYKGNSELCGLPLSKKCGPEQHSPPSPAPDKIWSEGKLGFGWKPVAIGYGCGFVFGIGLGYFMFLVGKPRWLVIIFGGQPKRRVKKRTRVRRTNGSTMNQMIQMS